eukprot:CAMPEP_0116010790 /NCGR_PEP_ID=MMETSP0321-20121206/4200_1 /TAXON_ID=163516 /ORGANISM="Leptocylindrus danicus var. danicus, Strain B650" /LENGTH=466 /DNA_ID=CAMNT_0003479935 /DNA_START=2352 /DNA_END=3752 /DNA_ORIENTATION=+
MNHHRTFVQHLQANALTSCIRSSRLVLCRKRKSALKKSTTRRWLTTSTTTKNGVKQQTTHYSYDEEQQRKFIRRIAYITGITGVITGASWCNRKWRNAKLAELPPASAETLGKHHDIKEVLTNVERSGLMGYQSSVKAELDFIREWHKERGYRGGLVVRELNEPLFSPLKQNMGGAMPGNFGNDDASSATSQRRNTVSSSKSTSEPLSLRELNTRECYYLYYEVLGNGQIVQQIFCRGTTLRDDVGQCIKSIYLYDSELGCNIHLGFREHAERLLRDVEPLLMRSNDIRGTIELSGHSLGGAVALIVALKLRKRGYNVTKVTTVGAPKLCDAEAVKTLEPMLPPDVLRVEYDRDIITFLPPTGCHLGDKLLFTSDTATDEEETSSSTSAARYLPSSLVESEKWTESFFLNCYLFETFTNMPNAHRVMTYVEHLQNLIDTMNLEGEKADQASDELPVGKEDKMIVTS